MNVWISGAAAVGAGLFLALSGVIQQKRASRRPEGSGLALIWQLIRDLWWLLGIGAALVSYGLQALALSFGPLALVQPLIVSELLFAVPLSMRLRGQRLDLRGWLAAGAVVAGLAVGIGIAQPTEGNPTQPFGSWVPVLAVIIGLAAACLTVTRFVSGPPKASAFGLAGAATMGTQSALYSATIAVLRQQGLVAVFTEWETYALIVASITGAILIQKAFQAGPLAASSPVIDAVLPIVSIVIGLLLFGEQINSSVVGLTGGIAGIILLVAGIILLDTSPAVRHEQRIEDREQEPEPADQPEADRAG